MRCMCPSALACARRPPCARAPVRALGQALRGARPGGRHGGVGAVDDNDGCRRRDWARERYFGRESVCVRLPCCGDVSIGRPTQVQDEREEVLVESSVCGELQSRTRASLPSPMQMEGNDDPADAVARIAAAEACVGAGRARATPSQQQQQRQQQQQQQPSSPSPPPLQPGLWTAAASTAAQAAPFAGARAGWPTGIPSTVAPGTIIGTARVPYSTFTGPAPTLAPNGGALPMGDAVLVAQMQAFHQQQAYLSYIQHQQRFRLHELQQQHLQELFWTRQPKAADRVEAMAWVRTALSRPSTSSPRDASSTVVAGASASTPSRGDAAPQTGAASTADCSPAAQVVQQAQRMQETTQLLLTQQELQAQAWPRPQLPSQSPLAAQGQLGHPRVPGAPHPLEYFAQGPGVAVAADAVGGGSGDVMLPGGTAVGPSAAVVARLRQRQRQRQLELMRRHNAELLQVQQRHHQSHLFRPAVAHAAGLVAARLPNQATPDLATTLWRRHWTPPQVAQKSHPGSTAASKRKAAAVSSSRSAGGGDKNRRLGSGSESVGAGNRGSSASPRKVGGHGGVDAPKSKAFPKMPTSLFLLFSARHRNEVRRTHPNISFAGMSRILGQMWKQVSAAEKHELKLEHAQQRREYETAVQRMIEEQASSTAPAVAMRDDMLPAEVAARANAQRKRNRRKLKRPKRPTSAYLYFTMQCRQHIRQRHPELSFTEVARELGLKWQILTDEERAPFTAMYEVDRERFREEERLWKESLMESAPSENPAPAK